MKYYIASKLENAVAVKTLAYAFEQLGWKQTYDWTAHGSVHDEGEEVLRQVTLKELGGVKEADVVVVVLPGGRGTHAELGAALAYNKPVFVWGQQPEDFIQDGYTCSFYFNPNVQRVEGAAIKLVRRLVDFCKENGLFQ